MSVKKVKVLDCIDYASSGEKVEIVVKVNGEVRIEDEGYLPHGVQYIKATLKAWVDE